MWREYPQKVLRWVGHVVREPLDELNRWQRAARFAYDLSRHGARQLREDRAPQMAAALAFQTLFALVPVLVVVMLLVQAFMEPTEMNRLVGKSLEWAGMETVSAPPTPDGAEPAPTSASLQTWLTELIDTAAETDLTVVGWIGFAVIVYSTVSMLVTIETSFNTVYRAPSGRPWSRRVPLYWFLITISPAAVYATVSAHQQVEKWADKAAESVSSVGAEEQEPMVAAGAGDEQAEPADERVTASQPSGTDEQQTMVAASAGDEQADLTDELLRASQPPGADAPAPDSKTAKAGTPWYLTVVHVAWSLTIGWLFWFTVYSLVPNTTVSLQSSAIGALVCAVLLEIAKRSLGAYLPNAFSISQLYGSLGLVPLFMFWVYLMWLFILFGLEVSATLQFLDNRALEEIEKRRATTGLVEPAAVVSVMEVVAEGFRNGQAMQQRKIADRTGVPEQAVATIVQELCKAGLLHRIDRDQNTVCLAQSPENVTADRLMDIGYRLADGAGERRISVFAERIREHQRALTKSITLASLVPAEGG